MSISDDQLRELWRTSGGTFYGPKVEHGDMEEAKLLPFLRQLVEERDARPDGYRSWQVMRDERDALARELVSAKAELEKAREKQWVQLHAAVKDRDALRKDLCEMEGILRDVMAVLRPAKAEWGYWHNEAAHAFRDIIPRIEAKLK